MTETPKPSRTKRLHGQEAIDYANQYGLLVNAYSDPSEEARQGLDPNGEEVADRLAADPELIWVEVPA